MGGFGFDWESQEYYDPNSPRYGDPDLLAQIEERKKREAFSSAENLSAKNQGSIVPEHPYGDDPGNRFFDWAGKLIKPAEEIARKAPEFATLPITVPKQGLDLLTAHLTDEDKVLPTGEVTYPSIGQQAVKRSGLNESLLPKPVKEFTGRAAEKAIDLTADPSVALMGGLGKAGNAVLGGYFGIGAAENLGTELGTGISEFEGGNLEEAAGHFGSATIDAALLGLIGDHTVKSGAKALRAEGLPDANIKLARPKESSTINVLDIEHQNPSLDFNVDPVVDTLPVEAAGIRDISSVTENASGESGASVEAMSRQSSMKSKGEKFVVYDRAGNRRELIGPDAVDFRAKRGETYGVEGPDGFRTLDDQGGNVVEKTGSVTSDVIPDENVGLVDETPDTYEITDTGESLNDLYLSDLLPESTPESQRGAIGPDLGPLNRFENSQAKKYGPEWRSKQNSSEAAFHEKLKTGNAKFESAPPAKASEEPVSLLKDDDVLPVDEDIIVSPDNVDRTIKRPDGSTMRFQTLDNETIRLTHTGKDGNVLSVKEGADFDSLQEIDSAGPEDIRFSESESGDAKPPSEIPPEKISGDPPKEPRQRLTRHRVRLSNNEIVKIPAFSPEDAVKRVNDYISNEYPDTDITANEAERMMNPIERAIEGEPGFEKKAQEIKGLSEKIEKGQFAEDEKGISQREKEFRQKVNLTQKIEGAQAIEEKNTRLKELNEAKKKLEEKPKTGRESITAEDSFMQAWNKLHPIEKASESLGIVKNFASGGDLGHLMRQGKLMTVDLLFSKDAKEVGRAIKIMGESTFSEKNFQVFHDRLGSDPFIKMMTDKFDLDLPGVGKGLKEESFHGNIAEKIPVIGKGYVRPSERAYTSYLNAIRVAELSRWKKILEKDGITPDNNPSAYRGMARAINIIGQRADISGASQHVFNEMSNVLWAPRSKFSRYQTIQELVGASSSDSIAKQMIRTSVAKVAAFNAGLLGLLIATYGPDEVEFISDPDRTDFLKIRMGNATIDPWMGLGPIIRSGVRLQSGTAKSPHTGKSRKVKPFETIGKELASGVAPGVAFLWELGKGEDLAGYQKERSDAFENFLPLSGRQINEILQELGPKGIPLAAGSYVGEGVDVFNYQKAKKEEDRLKRERGLKKIKSSGSKSSGSSRYAF